MSFPCRTSRRNATRRSIVVRPRFKSVSFADDGEKLFGVPTAHVDRIMRATKNLFGGRRPSNIDVVHTITDKNIYVEEGDGVGLGGMADCVGGIRYPNRAFAVSEGWGHNGPKDRFGHASVAQTAAHEIGHLLGARHEYSNCAEGPGISKCTLMFNARLGFLRSNVFGSLESAVVRGYAVEYARD
jgi:hypothetical protein